MPDRNKLVLLALLSAAALVMVWRSSEELAAPSSFTTSATRIEGWSAASFTAAAKTAVGTALGSFQSTYTVITNTTTSSSSSSSSNSTSSLASAAATTLKYFLRTEASSSDSEAVAAAPAAAPGSNKKHKLCVLSRIHNQPRSLAEWLEYHAALGITRFYLVDDCSTDSGRTRTVMDVYQQEGLVKYYTTEDVTRKQCAHVIQANETEAEHARERRRRRACQARGSESEEEAELQDGRAGHEV